MPGVVWAVLLLAASAAAQDGADGARHPSVRLGDVRLELLARVQLDARLKADAVERDEETPGLDIGRKRVGVRGRLARIAAFEVETELEARDPWRDVYIEYRQFRSLRVQAGHFKVPFSLDYTTSSAKLDFIDRSRAANTLAAGRDRGIMAHGRLLDDRLEYEAGAFAGRDTKAVRLAARPFGARRSAGRALTAAIAYTHGALDERLVDSVWVKGSRRRAGVELQWQPGPVALTGEYMRAADERLGQGIGGENLAPLVRTGWYGAGTWAVRPALGSRRPRLELAARVDGLRVGRGGAKAGTSFSPRAAVVAGRADQALTLGVNWYLGSRVKLQANGVRDRHAGRARWTPLARLQVVL
jgi:phosphate-selective porin OprO/OprP